MIEKAYKTKMKFNIREHWPICFFAIGAIAIFGFVTYSEIKIHYFLKFNGIVVRKEMIPPKKMPDLVVSGTNETFPTWKWEGIDFDEVQIGDSIVKRKFERKAYWFKKDKNGKFQCMTLNYWTF
jgi:hypothetical protein